MSIDLKTVTEFELSIQVNKDSLSPKRNDAYYCKELIVNRALVSTALSVYCSSGDSVFSPVRCLDGIGSSGVAGLIWKKYLGNDVDVSINDPRLGSKAVIALNARENNLAVNVLHKDPCVLLHETPFSFIYLDCHTDAALYLDSVFRNIAKRGILAITTKDDGALYGRTPEMALRNYGGKISKTFYAKEMAVRLILAGMVSSAARHSKGIKVLCVLSSKSSLTIIVQIVKGPAQATACMDKISRLIHCNMCEERAFHPLSSLYPTENPSKLLSCSCSETTPGKVTLELGPMWAGSLFEHTFVLKMIHHLPKLPWKKHLEELLETIVTEAWCPKLGDAILNNLCPEKKIQAKKTECSTEESKKEDEPPTKKRKEEDAISTKDVKESPESLSKKLSNEIPNCDTPHIVEQEPPFYYNLHRHNTKGPHMVKVQKIVMELRRAGFRCSRTHFDPMAVRTNADLKAVGKVLSETSD